ncbi:MAG: DUF3048 domain-containing protein [Nocardioidaceae bacterium]|nr:DUF3048 domain-containing protein [Nocardioidaceae bacterium]
MRPTRLRSALPTALPAALIALSLILAGCGGGDDGEKKAKSDSSQAAETPTTWPLTGLDGDGKSVELDHPVIVTKIDNTDSSAPQVGLSKADLIVEELVEGGVTRLAAFYYSQLPGDIGPVRSMRASDIGIASPADAVIATSGAAGETIARLKKAGVKYFSEGGPGFYRNSGRTAPYNLFTNLKKVAKAASDGKEERPADYLPWGSESDLPKGKPAGSLNVGFGSRTTSWKFENGTYTNTNSHAAEGDHFVPDTVLVLRVGIGDAGYKDPAGNFVPESKFVGSGKAQIFHNGQVIDGKWSKTKLGSPVSLKSAAGDLKVPAGKVWIELVPVDGKGGSVNYTK